MCSTSWSVSCDTRRSAGRLTFSMIWEAFFGPIPWIYCNAITTRLLVGRFTPAIRATCLLLLPATPAVFSAPLRGENAKCRDDTRPSARAGIGVVLMQNGCRELRDSKSFRQPLRTTELTPFRLAFRSFFAGLGRLAGSRLPCALRPCLGGGLGSFPGGGSGLLRACLGFGLW